MDLGSLAGTFYSQTARKMYTLLERIYIRISKGTHAVLF